MAISSNIFVRAVTLSLVSEPVAGYLRGGK
jgi:hypothetical protein